MHLTTLLSHAVRCICSPQEKRGEPQTQISQNTHELLMFCAAETRAARCLATKTRCYELLQIILYLPGKIRVLLTCFEYIHHVAFVFGKGRQEKRMWCRTLLIRAVISVISCALHWEITACSLKHVPNLKEGERDKKVEGSRRRFKSGKWDGVSSK